MRIVCICMDNGGLPFPPPPSPVHPAPPPVRRFARRGGASPAVFSLPICTIHPSIPRPARQTATARAILARCALCASAAIAHTVPPVSPAPPTAPVPTSPALSEVQGRDSSATPGYQGAQRNPAATRTDTPLIETPQSVRVVPRRLLEALGAPRLADPVDYV